MKSNNFLMKFGYVGGGVFITIISIVFGAFFVILLPIYTISWLKRRYKKSVIKNVEYKYTLLNDKALFYSSKLAKIKTKITKINSKITKYESNEKKVAKLEKQLLKLETKLNKIKHKQEALNLDKVKVDNIIQANNKMEVVDNSLFTKTNDLIKTINSK